VRQHLIETLKAAKVQVDALTWCHQPLLLQLQSAAHFLRQQIL
jgi:hypothetical protein